MSNRYTVLLFAIGLVLMAYNLKNMQAIKPSGVDCVSCKTEIDLHDGPVRMVGQPKRFPFCWECFHELYGVIPNRGHIIAKETLDGSELHIWLEISNA